MRQLIEHAMDSANDKLVRAFLGADQVFWVDDNDDEATVVAACAEAAGLQRAPKLDVTAEYAGPQATLLALNRAFRHSHEVRLALASVGGDSLAFVVLPVDQWRQLDDDIGDALVQVVWQLDTELDPFDDLDDGDVLGAYTELLEDAPGYYGDCLARALANPGSITGNRDGGEDELLQW